MEDTRARWERAFLEAVDFDAWGQVEEALEGYQRLQVAAAAEYVENVLQLPLHRRDGIGKLAVILKRRMQEMHVGSEKDVGLTKMKHLKSFMKDIIVSDAPFPLHGFEPDTPITSDIPTMEEDDDSPHSSYQGPTYGQSSNNALPVNRDNTVVSRVQQNTYPIQQQQSQHQQNVDLQSQPQESKLQFPQPSIPSQMPSPTHPLNNDAMPRSPLLPVPNEGGAPGRYVSLMIEKWGFKDSLSYVQPRVVISLRNAMGEPLEPIQETPMGRSSNSYVIFNSIITLETPLDRIPQDAALFFEFIHWKTDKKKTSCRAYSILEKEELRPGNVALEVYKKPAIYIRGKTPSLFTVKPLYLHLNVSFAL
uniref:C2 Aida-type domain-containing protein n=1 Tax=Polytomella parva TaxID=51329 RepID=A0A7S0UKK5_9CHLO|mmetsp:Transcript_12031/g.21566  ORF Transcript_12031/g.21566 Transcript_12031/m.21566 type:complete len:363 (+) Transcript_12031:51-1139(+)